MCIRVMLFFVNFECILLSFVKCSVFISLIAASDMRESISCVVYTKVFEGKEDCYTKIQSKEGKFTYLHSLR